MLPYCSFPAEFLLSFCSVSAQFLLSFCSVSAHFLLIFFSFSAHFLLSLLSALLNFAQFLFSFAQFQSIDKYSSWEIPGLNPLVSMCQFVAYKSSNSNQGSSDLTRRRQIVGLWIFRTSYFRIFSWRQLCIFSPLLLIQFSFWNTAADFSMISRPILSNNTKKNVESFWVENFFWPLFQIGMMIKRTSCLWPQNCFEIIHFGITWGQKPLVGRRK